MMFKTFPLLDYDNYDSEYLDPYCVEKLKTIGTLIREQTQVDIGLQTHHVIRYIFKYKESIAVIIYEKKQSYVFQVCVLDGNDATLVCSIESCNPSSFEQAITGTLNGTLKFSKFKFSESQRKDIEELKNRFDNRVEALIEPKDHLTNYAIPNNEEEKKPWVFGNPLMVGDEMSVGFTDETHHSPFTGEKISCCLQPEFDMDWPMDTYKLGRVIRVDKNGAFFQLPEYNEKYASTWDKIQTLIDKGMLMKVKK